MGDQVALDWLRFATVVLRDPVWQGRQRVGAVAASTFKAEQLVEDLTKTAHTISARMLAGRVSDGHATWSIMVPASWWQHLRYSAPRWYRELFWVRRWRQRHPVRMTKNSVGIDMTRHLAYPLADLFLPPRDFGYPIVEDALTYFVDPLNVWKHDIFTGDREIDYASRYEIAREIEHSFVRSDRLGDRTAVSVLTALAKLGVNPDQLVTQAALDTTTLYD